MTSSTDRRRDRIRLPGIIGIENDVDGRDTVQHLTYRIFIGIVSLNALVVLIGLYFIPLSAAAKEVLAILDVLNGFIFLLDFLLRLATSPKKAHYFFVEWGWVDLIGSLPAHPLLRLLRILRSIGLWFRLARTTTPELREEARHRLAESTLFVVASIVVLVVTFGSLAMALIEAPVEGSNIKTGSDAVWYVMVTIATVGYGDKYPVTNPGRVMGVILMVVGVSVFSVLTSYVASRFLARRGET